MLYRLIFICITLMSFWLPSGLASTPPPMDISDIDKYDATDEDSKEVNGARSNEMYEHTEETDDNEEEDPDFNEIQNLISPSINGTKEDLLHKVFELLDNVDSENVLHDLEQAINDAFNSIETSKWYCESGNTATAKVTEATTTTTTTVETTTLTTTTPIRPTIVEPLKKCGANNENQCVKHWQCKATTSDPKFIVDLSTRSDCPYMQVCCSADNLQLEEVQEYAELEKNKVTYGFSDPNGVRMSAISRKAGITNFGEYPWTVLIYQKTNQFFTGTLIHPEIVLSVAAYVNKKTPEDYRVVAGDWDEKTTDEILANEELRVKTIQVHPAFDHNSYANNVALLFLNGHFTLMSHILPIALPKPPGKLHRHCLVSGWNQKGRSYERNLKVSMPLSVAPCSKEVQSLYCVDAAKNDLQYAEGAGMACKVDDFANEYYLIGVWSHGLGASVSKTKFVSVEAVLPWIKAEQKNYSEKTK